MRLVGCDGLGQVFDGFLILAGLKKRRVVGGFLRGALGTEGLHFVILRTDEFHHIHGGNGKKEHKTEHKYQDDQHVGRRAPKQRQQHGTHRSAQNAALPEIGGRAGVQQLDSLPRADVGKVQPGKNHRHRRAKHAHQRNLGGEYAHAVAACQQVCQI